MGVSRRLGREMPLAGVVLINGNSGTELGGQAHGEEGVRVAGDGEGLESCGCGGEASLGVDGVNGCKLSGIRGGGRLEQGADEDQESANVSHGRVFNSGGGVFKGFV